MAPPGVVLTPSPGLQLYSATRIKAFHYGRSCLASTYSSVLTGGTPAPVARGPMHATGAGRPGVVQGRTMSNSGAGEGCLVAATCAKILRPFPCPEQHLPSVSSDVCRLITLKVAYGICFVTIAGTMISTKIYCSWYNLLVVCEKKLYYLDFSSVNINTPLFALQSNINCSHYLVTPSFLYTLQSFLAYQNSSQTFKGLERI